MALTGGPLDRGDLLRVATAGGPRRAAPVGAALRSTAIALVSTIVFAVVVGWIVVNAPGWPRVQESFLNGEIFARTFGFIDGTFVWERSILRHLLVNVRLFLVAEVFILILGLVLAVMRSLPGPVLFPIRALAVIYTDIFRALPGLLVIFMLGFGIPGLGIEGIPTDRFLYGVIALTLLYSAYVSEVYRAGIDSIHPSQTAAARSLGLTQFQALRHVVLPQAVRRVIPPLLNDFIGLQKDTVLVSALGVVEIFRQSQIVQAATFNFTPYLATALVFVVVTIPLARLTDWLVARDRRRAASSAR